MGWQLLTLSKQWIYKKTFEIHEMRYQKKYFHNGTGNPYPKKNNENTNESKVTYRGL